MTELLQSELFKQLHQAVRVNTEHREMMLSLLEWPHSLKIDENAPRETWQHEPDKIGERTDAFLRFACSKSGERFGLHVKILGPTSSNDPKIFERYSDRAENMKADLGYSQSGTLLVGTGTMLKQFATFTHCFDAELACEDLGIPTPMES